jgi:hypothetical protein
MSEKIGAFTLRRRSLCEPFGKLDEHPPVGGRLDFPEGNDEAQTLDDIQIQLIGQQQLQ